MPFTKKIDTGMRSRRSAFKNGSCNDWPLPCYCSFVLGVIIIKWLNLFDKKQYSTTTSLANLLHDASFLRRLLLTK